MNAILELSKNSNVTVSETSVTASEVVKAVLDGAVITPASLRIAELEKELVLARAEQEKEIAAEKARIEKEKKAAMAMFLAAEQEKRKTEWEAAYTRILSGKDEMTKLREQLRKYTEHARDVFNKNRNYSIVFLMNKWMGSSSNAYYLTSGRFHYANLKDMAEEFCKSKYNTGNDNGDGWIFSTTYANIVFLKNYNIDAAKCSQEFIDQLFEFLTDLT